MRSPLIGKVGVVIPGEVVDAAHLGGLILGSVI
jgi:hypothetical protein